MKKSYWLILVFLVWCVGSSLWYMFGVKGVSTDPSHFNAQASLVTIIEILLMILGAFIIGFGTAWLLREDTVHLVMGALQEAEYKLESQRGSLDTSRADYEGTYEKLLKAEERIGQLIGEREVRKRQEEDAFKQIQLWQRQVRELEAKNQQIEAEASSVKFRLRLLENEVAEKEGALVKLQQEAESVPSQAVNHRDWSDHPFVRPVEIDEDDRDDLTQIKGIGPKFMQKLYSLDIVSFRQLKELSGAEVERLAEVIEVFPDRIHRDNWIGQATKLYQKKMEARA